VPQVTEVTPKSGFLENLKFQNTYLAVLDVSRVYKIWELLHVCLGW